MLKTKFLKEFGFSPKTNLNDLGEIFPYSYSRETTISSTELVNSIKNLLSIANPEDNGYYKLWNGFYLPILDKSKVIPIPLDISESEIQENTHFFIGTATSTHLRLIEDGKSWGSNTITNPTKHIEIIQDIKKFAEITRKNGLEFLEKIVPYSNRTGTILGKHARTPLISEERKFELEEKYKKHQEKNLQSKSISLNNYLKTASICYKATYQKKVENKTPIEMYKMFADFRHGGMLNVENWNSKKEYSSWLNSRVWEGCHPFEIIYSPRMQGIRLFPPGINYEHYYYQLSVTDPVYTEDFLKIVEALIEEQITFQAPSLQNRLNYASGNTEFSVNRRGFESNLHYCDSKEEREKYFDKIVWDALQMPDFK